MEEEVERQVGVGWKAVTRHSKVLDVPQERAGKSNAKKMFGILPAIDQGFFSEWPPGL